jgi:multidrug resistance efflux pump
VAQAQAEQRGRQIAAAKQAEDDLALRQEELHEAEAELKLAEAGSRPEEVDAEKARIARITEELQYLQYVQRKLVVPATANGVVTTQYLNERLGEYVREGDLLCELEDVESYEAEIQVSEDDLARIDEGQPVRIRVRAMPFDAFTARIDRISPRARFDEHQTHGTLTCVIQDASQKLRPGMTGSARIETGYRAIGALLLDRSTRFLKNEFWWW